MLMKFRSLRLMFLFMLSTLVLGGCKNSLSSKTEQRTLAPFQKSAVTLVGASGKKTNAVTFQQLSGNLEMKGDQPSSVNVTLQAVSMASSDPKLNVKLKEKSFFEVQKYPTVTFQSDRFEKVENSSGKQFNVTGELNVKGKVTPVRAPATLSVENEEVILALQVAVSKEDWVKIFLENPDDFFSDSVDVIAKLTFPKNPVIESSKKE
jgi:polyisoprenoid-binding protein YceI